MSVIDDLLERCEVDDDDDENGEIFYRLVKPPAGPRKHRPHYGSRKLLKKETRMSRSYKNISEARSTYWWEDHPVQGRGPDIDSVIEVMLARGEPGPVVQYCDSKSLAEGKTHKDVLEAIWELVPDAVEACRVDDARDECTREFWFPAGWIQIAPFGQGVSVNAVALGPEVLAPLMSKLEELLTSAPPAGTVYMMTATQNGPKFHAIGQGGMALERANYTPEVLAGYDRIREELRILTPRGRLTIIDGQPGTGKTYVVRGLLQEVEKVVFVVVPPHFLPSLGEPTALTALTKLRTDNEGKPIVFVVEDADECLAPRDGANISAISAVLNLGDGIMGSMLDIRVVATTNAERQELDPAVKRPGRLSTALHIGGLTPSQAEVIYQRLMKAPIELRDQKEYTLAEIYQRAYDSGWKPATPTTSGSRRVGFGG